MENSNIKRLVDELTEDEQLDKEIVKTFKVKKTLSPLIFDTKQNMHDSIREKLLQNANNFIEFIGFDFFIYDVILTGSLSNYNWSKYSDMDIHILINMGDIFNDEKENKFIDILNEFFITKKSLWNKSYSIKVKNYDVEFYVEDVNINHISSGIYSILNNKWIIKPQKKKEKIDEKKILSKAKEYTDLIDSLLEKEDIDVSDEVKRIKDKLRKFRKSGLESGGEFSYENLVYKLLRRNGYIKKLSDIKKDFINKSMSLNETPDFVETEDRKLTFSLEDALAFSIFYNTAILSLNKKLFNEDLLWKIRSHYDEKLKTNKEPQNFFSKFLNKKEPRSMDIKFLDHGYQGILVNSSTHDSIPPFYELLRDYGIIKKDIGFTKYYNKTGNVISREFTEYPGRLWYKSKIITFWDYPEDKERLFYVLNKINETAKIIYGTEFNFNEYRIELNINTDNYEEKLIPINQYISSKDVPDNIKSIPHLLSPIEKNKIDTDKTYHTKKYSDQEKDWKIMAKRNFYMNKDMSESEDI